MSLFSLENKNAVVIGGAGGLGQAIAQGLAEAGAKVAIASRKVESLQRAAGEIKEACGKEVVYYTVDATNEESIEKLVNETVADLGQIHILVNAQGFNKKFDAVDFPMDTFRELIDVNIVSVMMCCKHFGKHMCEKGYGKIVNLSSTRGQIATIYNGNAAYCTSKGAVNMMTKQLAAEFGPFGVTVNAIGPTVTETPMMTKTIETRGGDAYRQKQANGLPLRRMAVPTDCVGPVVFLASDASCFVTGQTLYNDGGLTAIG